MEKDIVKMPLWIRAFIFFYIGAYGIYSTQYNLVGNTILLDVLKICAITIFAMFFSYGLICFINDYKKGGIRKVINKIKNTDEHL